MLSGDEREEEADDDEEEEEDEDDDDESVEPLVDVDDTLDEADEDDDNERQDIDDVPKGWHRNGLNWIGLHKGRILSVHSFFHFI